MEETEGISWNVRTRKILIGKRRLLNNNSKLKSLKADSSHFHQIFPVEICTLVINKLSGFPDDLENLLNSSPFFRNLMASQRTTFLFEKVLALVAPTVWKNEGFDGLSLKDILNCRGVCLEWNHFVDKLISENFHHFGQTSMSEARCIGNKFKSLLRNEIYIADDQATTYCPQNVLRHFERTHALNNSNRRDPFIWGSLRVMFWHQTPDKYLDYKYERCLEDVSLMFWKYGSYLRTLTLDFEGSIIQTSDLPLKLKPWLLCLPNLKEFKFYCNEDYRPSFELWSEEDFNIFPKFQLLETLRVGSDVPFPLFNQLMEQNNLVSNFEFFGNWSINYNLFTIELPYISSLDLDLYEINPDFIEHLVTSEVQWQLESLTLKFYNHKIHFGTLLQFIQDKFANTLVALQLSLDRDYEEYPDQWRSYRLDLPKLKIFKIECFDGNPVCLDFLLPMEQNLEEISISVHKECVSGRPSFYDEEVDGTDTVQVSGFEYNMLDSNIWDIFKQLKKVEIKVGWKYDLGRYFTRLYLKEERMPDFKKSE